MHVTHQTNQNKMCDKNGAIIKYISCACNRVPNCLDWGNNNLVCFGVKNSVAIYDTGILPYGKIKKTLYQHEDRVNFVQWIKSLDKEIESELISISDDNNAIIWTSHDNFETYQSTSVINFGEPVNICTTIIKSTDLLVFLGSINGSFQLWSRSTQNELSKLQTLDFKKKLGIFAKFCILPNKFDILLAVALEDFSIQILLLEESKFVPVAELVGHENWVTCLDFVVNFQQKTVLLASGSQDQFIRLWKICPESAKGDNDQLEVKKTLFEVTDGRYEITLESVLCGHSGWIYGVHWYSEPGEGSVNGMKLLSSSLDKSMIIWKYDDKTEVWTESMRVGDVGGNSAGFYGGKFGPNGKSVLGHGYTGSLYRWDYFEENGSWCPLPGPSGHFDEVVDLTWDKYGRYLLTTSVDQTTRIHAPWILNESTNDCWYEISRPQIHGYNMACITSISPNVFASGAEEKVIRIFIAPVTFKKYLNSITNCHKQYEMSSKVNYDLSYSKLFQNLVISNDDSDLVAHSASVPALGLHNKAVFNIDDFKEEDGACSTLDFNRPPLEEELVQHTLWPEKEKLYGHGYELFAMAATHDGKLLATASRSTSYEHAAIIIWKTKQWVHLQKLHFHQLTVTQLEFSVNDKYLLAVSRDRMWSIYELKDEKYTLVANMKKNCLHKRIIWCCSWSTDSLYFATGSRDGKIGIWNINDIDNYKSLEIEGESVTAISFAQADLSESCYFLAVGFDSGSIEIYVISKNFEVWKKRTTFDNSFGHHSTVKRLKFRPMCVQTNVLHLASCGSDNAVKIYELSIKDLEDFIKIDA